MGTSINLVVTSLIVSSMWFSRTFLPDFIIGPIIDVADYISSLVAVVGPNSVASDFDTGFLIVLTIGAPLVLYAVAKSRRLLEIRT